MSMLIAACLLVGQAAALPSGPAKVEVAIDGYTLDVFTYKPASYRGGPMLMVFHGVSRNAEEYRDDARGMADRFGALVVAPQFDAKQFGRGMYQQGGVFRQGQVVERAKWTFSLIPKLIDELRRMEQAPDLPCYLIGHSAGGQFLGRMGAFMTAGAERVVIANAGSYIFPTRDMDYPYGFGGLPDELCDDDDLRKYLARPLTLYLGTGDTERDVDLDKSPRADREGPNRYERGKNAFRAAQELARDKGWEFNWKLVEAPGVVHDHRAMFDAPACEAALFGKGNDQ
jgi:hypothetical protein